MAEAFFTAAGQIQHSVGSPVSGGVFTITSTPSTKVTVDSQGVFRGFLSVSFSGGNMSGMVPGSVIGAGVINPTALKCKIELLAVVRDKDSGNFTGTAVPTAGPPPVPVSIPCECADSQTKAKGD